MPHLREKYELYFSVDLVKKIRFLNSLEQLYCPVYPVGQAHVYPLGSLCRVLQVPPFLQGLFVHGDVSEKNWKKNDTVIFLCGICSSRQNKS